MTNKITNKIIKSSSAAVHTITKTYSKSKRQHQTRSTDTNNYNNNELTEITQE